MTDRIIGLDLGTSCGWAVLRDDGSRVASGVWDLKGGRYEGGGMRYLRFERLITELVGQQQPRLVAFEEVRRHAGTSAAHVYGGLLAILTKYLEAAGIPYQGIPVGTIKKLATGKGNADKSAMFGRACEQWDTELAGDDEADALWCAEAGRRA